MGKLIKVFTNALNKSKIKPMKTFFTNHWLKLVAMVMLLGALLTFPFVYYQLMNWIVVGAALVTVQQSYQRNNHFFVWLFALVAVVFNPLAPLYLSANVWHIVDITTAVLFLLSFGFITSKKK